MCLVGSSLFPASGRAQPAAALPPLPKGTNAVTANRWLIIVETSKRMRSRADGVQQEIPALVFSGMNGQMWRGDTLGVWTFNEELHAGQFPLQEWTPGNSQAIALEVSDFLKSQKYQKDSYLDKVIPYMQRIIKSSDYITVLLVSDGQTKIQGTPFDNKINAYYQTWEKQQEKAHMPFITVFRADHGQITNYAVTIPPYPLELPPLPPELAKRKVEPVVSQPAPQQTVPPLIVHGKKPVPEPAVTNTVDAATNTNITPLVSATTNQTSLQTSEPAAVSGEGKAVGTPPPATSVVTVAKAPLSVKTNETPAIAVAAATASNVPSQTGEPERPTVSAGSAPDKRWSHKTILMVAGGAVVLAFWLGWTLGRAREPFRVSLLSPRPDGENEN